MSSLTKEQMRNALISHGVPNLPPQAAKKEEWAALYEEHVMPVANGAADFSSDDEVSLKPSPSKRASTASKASRASNVSRASKSSKSPKKAVVEDSMTVDGVDISALDDDELFEKLKEHGISAGPIVDSTRKLYEKKLALILKGETANGNGVEYSDTEEEEEEQDEEQEAEVIIEPTVTTRRSASAKNSNSSQKKSPAKSPFSSMLKETIGLRNRGGQDSLDAARDEKLTPTPRRSIHSYKVSETTKQVITRNRDGTETRDVQHSVERTENGRVISESSGVFMKYFIKVLKLAAVLALLVAVYLAFTSLKNDESNFDEIMDAVKTANTAQAESGQETVAPEAPEAPEVPEVPPAADMVDV